jgi:Uma2 family endonuclease
MAIRQPLAMTVPPPLFTASDLLVLPADARYELIRGELIEMTPPPGAEHGKLNSRLGSRISVFAEDHDLGEGFSSETGFLVEQHPDTVIAPDWAFVRKEKLPARTPQGYLTVAPDLVLETRSPSDRPREVVQKVTMWLNAGVRIVWELNPATRTLTVHRKDRLPRVLGPADTVTGEEVLPGFEFALAGLFPEAQAEE